ncbi:MAG: VWA domain-containing protein [Deltaproteobacteria bacterium]|nr:VWA domain-containing protein [Deltaproteobacteria bacterium]
MIGNRPGRGGVQEETSSSAVHLSDIQEVLDIYLSGLMEEPLGIRKNRIWKEGKGYVFGLIRRANRQVPATPADSYTDLKRIYLPERIDTFDDREENFALYKAIIAHKYGQIRFGSLEVLGLFDRMENPDRVLDLFSIIEDARMERHLSEEMEGLATLLNRLKEQCLRERPEPEGLTVAEQRVEALLRLSLHPVADLSGFVPSVRKWADPFREEMIHLVGNGSSPSDSARLALRMLGGLNGVDGPYRKIDAVPYRGWMNLPSILRTLKGAVRVAAQGQAGDRDQEETTQKKTVLSTDRKVTPEATEFDEEEARRGILLNRFEKISMIAKYFRISRPLDTDEDVGELSKALDELESTGMIRTARKAKTLLHVEEDFEIEPGELENDSGEAVPGLLYDEWDYRIGALRKDWCTLIERVYDREDIAWSDRLMEKNKHLFTRVRREFQALRPEYRKLRKRINGEDVDNDAFIEAWTDMQAGVMPSEKIYIEKRRRRKEIATIFLADLSASTDAYVKNLRVMDQQREALLLLGEAMEAIGDRYGIFGFSSKTRKACSLYTLKGIDEGYGSEIRGRIGGMRPLDYTRMGPAIRHITHLFQHVRARTKLLIILSDGKPNDFDTYEGRYGIEDIKKALLSARASGILSFCITVDTEARAYLPEIFERGNFLILDEIESLPRKLVGMYRKLTGLTGR